MRIRTSALAVLFSFVVPSVLLAWTSSEFIEPTAAELAMKSLASASGASAAILNWSLHQDDVDSFSYEYVRTKIFTAEGKKYGDIELIYVPGFTSIRAIKARTIHADGTQVDFNGKVYDKLIVRAGGLRVSAKTFSMPDVQPGSIIEYRYTMEWPQGLLRNTRWVLQREVPVVKAELWLKPYEKQYSSFFTHTGLPAGKIPERKRDHYELVLENIPAFESEPYAPPEAVLKPNVNFFYTSGKVDPTAFWQVEGENWARTIENFIGNDRKLVKQTADEVTAHATTPNAKLRELYARVQRIKNLSFEEEKTEQEASRTKTRDNNNVEDVLRNGYGYRAELNRLFVALARAAGFDAYAVRVSPRDDTFFAKSIPDGDQLSAEIALVNYDGEPHYFDAGTPYASFGLLSWEKTNTFAMKIAKKTSGEWVEIPLTKSSEARTIRKAKLELADDVLKGTVTVTFTGQDALARRLAHHNDDDAETKKKLEAEVKNWFPEGSTVKLKSVTGLRAAEEPLAAEYDVELANLGAVTPSRALVPLSVFAASKKNPFSSEQRKNPVYFEYAWRDDDEVTVTLPEGYMVESLPKGTTLNLGGVKYTNEWSQDGRSITFKRNFTVDTILVDAAQYRVIRNFYSRVATADQETMILKKQASAKGVQ